MSAAVVTNSSRGDWFRRHEAFPMLVRRFSSSNSYPPCSATALAVARSLRRTRAHNDVCEETSNHCAKSSISIKEEENHRNGNHFRALRSSSTSTTGCFHHTKGTCVREAHTFYNDLITCGRKSLYSIPVGQFSLLSLRKSMSLCPLKNFFTIRSELLAFRSSYNFSHLFFLSWQRLLPLERTSISLYGFYEVLKAVLHIPLEISDIYFLFSFICNGKKKVSIKSFNEQVKPLFLPPKKFSCAVCVHIIKNTSWPSYFFLTRSEVENLLFDVENAKECSFPIISASVQEVFKSLKVLGLMSDRIPISTLHDLFCADTSFQESLVERIDSGKRCR